MKMPKIPKSVSKILENKYVLYFVLFLAFTNIIGYLVLGNFTAIIFFILVGYLVYNFSKNMIIVLSVPIILTSMLMIGQKVKEGLENASDDTSKSTDEKDKDVKKEVKVDDKKNSVSETPTLDSEKIIGLSDNVNDTQQEPTGENMTNMGKNKNRIDYLFNYLNENDYDFLFYSDYIGCLLHYRG